MGVTWRVDAFRFSVHVCSSMLPNLYRHSRRINGKVKGFLPLSQSGFSFPLFFFYYFVVLLVVFLFFIPSFLSIFYFQFLLVAICWFYSSFPILCLLIQIFKKKKMNENKDQ